mgnify:CR=1 FL=1
MQQAVRQGDQSRSQPLDLDAPITRIRGVGPKLAGRLATLGMLLVRDLLRHYPRDHVDYSAMRRIEAPHRRMHQLVREIMNLADRGDREAARALLTHYSSTRAIAALDMGDTVADALDAYTRLVTGRRPPAGGEINTLDPTVNCLSNGDPDIHPGN